MSLIGGSLLFSAFLNAQSGLSEIEKLKAENFKLRVQLIQCKADVNDRDNKLASQTLSAEYRTLEAEFKKSLGCTEAFDFTTLTCKENEKTP